MTTPNNDDFESRWQALLTRLDSTSATIEPLEALTRAVTNTPTAALSHQECLAQLSIYIAEEVDGYDVARRYPTIKRHLDSCMSCEMEYANLLTTAIELQAEIHEEIIPLLESTAAQILSATSKAPIAAVDKGVERWSTLLALTKRFVARIAPRELPDFEELMREYADRYTIGVSPRTGGVEFRGVLAFEPEGVVMLPLTTALAAMMDYVLHTGEAQLPNEGLEALIVLLDAYGDSESSSRVESLAPHFSTTQLQLVRNEALKILKKFGVRPSRAEQIVTSLVNQLRTNP